MNNVWVWCDLEMTGLSATDRIMEVAFVLTDTQGQLLAPVVHEIVGLSDPVLDTMNAWCRKFHGESGLTEACRQSSRSILQIEDQVMQLLAKHSQAKQAPLCGNSVHADRQFLQREMPRVHDWLHYRHIDVSTLKQLYQAWQIAPPFVKKSAHRALDDIMISIEELRYYKQWIG